MYYRRVNRGLSFTKPGVYAFGLILLVGMIAVTTGINGLYVFLSAGLGGFIISGMLSELAIKSCTIQTVTAALADAEQPFDVHFTMENSSHWFSVFAMQSLFLLQAPRFRLIATPPNHLGGTRIDLIAAKEVLTFRTTMSGMPRGHYKKMLAMQLTTFPFGILEKFKLVEIESSLLLAPKVDRAFLDELRPSVQKLLAARDADKEFYSHRSYQARDSLRDIDWKKSAGRPEANWVIRQYKSRGNESPVVIDAPWSYAVSLGDAADYEGYLARIRTAMKVLEDANLPWLLEMGPKLRAQGYEACLSLLARAPKHKDRMSGLGFVESVAEAPTYAASPESARLEIRLSAAQWVKREAS